MPAVEISYSLDLDPDLPKELEDIAKRQGEDPETVCSLLQELKDLVYERGHFKPIRMDNEFLLKFLRSRYFKLESAYKLFQKYHEFRNNNPILHVDVNPLDLVHLGEEDVVSVAPYRDQKGRRMIFYKIGNWKPSTVSIDEILKATLIVVEMGSLEPSAQILGGIGIFDFEGLSLNHAWHLNPSIAQKIICLMVTSMPLRTEEIHIINQSWSFDIIYQLFRPFLNEKMRSKIFIHGNDLSSFHKYIDPGHLPNKYGGDLPEYSYTEWMDYLTKNKKVINELEQLGYRFEEELQS